MGMRTRELDIKASAKRGADDRAARADAKAVVGAAKIARAEMRSRRPRSGINICQVHLGGLGGTEYRLMSLPTRAPMHKDQVPRGQRGGNRGRFPQGGQLHYGAATTTISETPSYVNAGKCCNFLRELPAGPAVAPPINGSVCAVGGRTSSNSFDTWSASMVVNCNQL